MFAGKEDDKNIVTVSKNLKISTYNVLDPCKVEKSTSLYILFIYLFFQNHTELFAHNDLVTGVWHLQTSAL